MGNPEELLQERMTTLIRAFGLHRTDRTPCGEPVPISEAHALAELSQTPLLTPTELAACLRLDRSTVTRLVQHLAERGWLARERDARDGRIVRLRLTPPGHQAAMQLATARAAKFAGIAGVLTVAERDSVLHALGLLVRALDAVEGDKSVRPIAPPNATDPVAIGHAHPRGDAEAIPDQHRSLGKG